MKTIIATFLILIELSFAQVTLAKAIKFGLERMDGKRISFIDIKKELSCYPSLISHWNREEGFATEIKISVGNFEFLRTDVGKPDGILHIFNAGKEVCEIELSLMPDMYFNSKDRLLIISGHTGSNNFIEVFSLKEECRYLGYSTIDSKDDLEDISKNWYQQPDGNGKCKK